MRYAIRILPVLLLLTVLADTARADQAAWVSRANARAAKTIIESASAIRHFCAPCGDTHYTEEAVKTVAVAYTGNANWYMVKVNGEGVDLAYTYAREPGSGRWKNIAIARGIDVIRVPEYLNAEKSSSARQAPTTTQTPHRIYDARLNLEPTQPTAAESALLNRTVKQKARQVWGDRRNCKEDFRVVDATTGSFTRPQAQQRLFLYSYCMTGHNFFKNGIAVVESGKLVAHFIYSGGGETAVGALPDLNENDYNEVIVAGGTTNMGITNGSVSILEIGAGNVRTLGSIRTFRSRCGQRDPSGPSKEAFVLYATENPQPQFFRQRLVSRGCETTRWVQRGKRKAIDLKSSSVSYTRVR